MEKFIVIKGSGSISALGHNSETIQSSYRLGKASFQLLSNVPVGSLSEVSSGELQHLITENKIYRGLDRSVLMAIYASREAIANAGWESEQNICINIGSSRGATSLFEQYIK